MIHRKINGLIVSEQGAEQWLGTDAEYLADFGAVFNENAPPVGATLAAACRARETRGAPPPVPAPTKAERIKTVFQDNPVMLALIDDLATVTGRTRAQVLTSLVSKIP